MKVLLSDPNLITSSKITSLLKSQGWEVLTATRWNKAKAILKENTNVKVAVINLEGFGGEELLENLKREYPDIKVIAFCGHKNIQLQQRAKELGAELVVPNSAIASSAPQLVKQVIS